MLKSKWENISKHISVWWMFLLHHWLRFPIKNTCKRPRNPARQADGQQVNKRRRAVVKERQRNGLKSQEPNLVPPSRTRSPPPPPSPSAGPLKATKTAHWVLYRGSGLIFTSGELLFYLCAWAAAVCKTAERKTDGERRQQHHHWGGGGGGSSVCNCTFNEIWISSRRRRTKQQCERKLEWVKQGVKLTLH